MYGGVFSQGKLGSRGPADCRGSRENQPIDCAQKVLWQLGPRRDRVLLIVQLGSEGKR